MFYDEFEVEGKMIPIRIPENAYKIIKTDAENLCKEAESTVEAITQTAALLFIGHVDAAVSLAESNGGLSCFSYNWWRWLWIRRRMGQRPKRRGTGVCPSMRSSSSNYV